MTDRSREVSRASNNRYHNREHAFACGRQGLGKERNLSIKASEISDLIKARISTFDAAVEASNVGTVVSVTDGIVRVHGLADVRYGEMIEFAENTYGLALNLERDSVGAVGLGDYGHLREGQTVKTTGRI